VGAKWTLEDPVSGTSYTFTINPTGDSPVNQKTLNYESTAAPSDSILLYEGADQPTTFSVSGTILTLNQYSSFMFFYQLRRQTKLTDDLNRVRWIYLTQFSPVRVRSATFPAKMTYQLSGYILSEELPTGDRVVFNSNPVVG
jgi:hypothetical protein